MNRLSLGRSATLLAVAVAIAVLAGMATTPMGQWLIDETSHAIVRLTTSWSPPDPGKPADRDIGALDVGADVAGRVIWGSNRTGDHEIYELDLKTGERRRLTRHPHVDFQPRFSPDGERIVFLRSRRPWVSVRETPGWDVWLMNSDGSGQRRLAEQGYYARWTSDGDTILFSRDSDLIAIDPDSRQEEVVFDRPEGFPRVRFGEMTLSRDGDKVAAAVSAGKMLVADVDGSDWTELPVDQACEPYWMPHGPNLVWVQGGAGNGGNRIVQGPPDGSDFEVLMDLPGKRSHEYFPMMSDDGSWMVWAATAEGHEQDRADYEIYLWRVGSRWDRATRLTHHTGNDNWPDIHLDSPS